MKRGKKLFKKNAAKYLAAFLAASMSLGSMNVVAASGTSEGSMSKTIGEGGELHEVVIPAPSADGSLVGATMPYTRYDSKDATLGGGARLKASADFSEMNIATQASEQSYVELPGSGAYAEWTMKTDGNGVTMRFTLPDTGDGMGQNGSLDVYVNGTKVKTVDLTSYYMWQYFASGHPSDSNDGGAPAFAFDETHFLLNTKVKAGDKIRIQSSGANNLTYGVDFLEIEEVAEPIAQPANSLSVIDYGAKPNDGIDDLAAIQACIAVADVEGKDVYIPAGTYHINETWRLYASDMKITGAGMWYTNIQFTNDRAGMGGISGGWSQQGGSAQDGYCKNVEFCNMYINSNLRSRYNQMAVYKCFMDIWSGAVIHDIWEEHFECGFWFGDYNGNMDYCDDAVIMNCRIRNNLADGVNFCQGTSNATVYNCSIRNNGDDGLAMWNDSTMGAKDESGNVFCYNTIDLIWRAGGIAIYGGDAHKVYNNYIADTFMASGIHLNTTFPGHKFSNNKGIEISNNIIVRSGTTSDCWNEDFGAIDIKGEVKNITFNNTQIYDSQHDAIRIWDYPTDIVFNDTIAYGVGMDGRTSTYSDEGHKGALLKFLSPTATPSVTFNGMKYANVAYSSNDGVRGSLANCSVSGWTNLGNNYSYTIPAAGKVGSLNTDHRNGGGFVITNASTGAGGSVGGSTGGSTGGTTVANGCDLVITDIRLVPENAKAGDAVKIQVTVENQGNEASPAGVKHGLAVSVGSKNYAAPTIWCDTYFDSIPAGGSATLITNGGAMGSASFTASTGAFSVYAMIDDQSLISERNEGNNEATLLGTFAADGNEGGNVEEDGGSGSTGEDSGNSGGDTGNTGNTESVQGIDLIITDIKLIPENAKAGDEVAVQVTVQNQGSQASPAGTKHGVAVSVGSKNYSAPTLWCDTHFDSIPAGGSVTLTTNGGQGGKGTFKAENGSFHVYAMVDDQVDRALIVESNESNNEAALSGNFTADGNTITSKIVTNASESGNQGGSEEGNGNESGNESGNEGGNESGSGNESGNEGEGGSVVVVPAGVSASSSNGLYPASNAGDGSVSTYWEASASTADVTLSIGGIKAVKGVVLKLNPDFAWSARTQKVEVQTSVDGVNYTTVKAAATYTFNPATGNTVEISFNPATASFIRLNMSENTGAVAPQLAEFGYVEDTSVTPKFPDITVTASTQPATITVGDTVTLKAMLRNEGGASIEAGKTVKVVFTMDKETFEVIYSNGIAAGEIATVTTEWIANKTGEYYLTVDADVDNAVVELSEGNNSTTSIVNVNAVAGADLVIDGLAIAPSSPSAGDEVVMTARVTNVGNAATKAGNLVVEATVTEKDGNTFTLVSAAYTQSIPVGETVTIELKQTSSGEKWIAKDTGYSVTATVDTNKISGEDSRNAGNNTASASYYFGRGASMPFTVMEAEDAKTNGTVLEKNFLMADYAGEASGRSAVKLDASGEYVEFTLTAPANAFVLRSGLADNTEGTISVYIDGKDTADFNVTSKFSHVYTTPDNLGQLGYQNQGATAYWLYEDAQLLLDTTYPAGTKVRIQKDSSDVSEIYVDMIETEEVAPAKTNPDPEQYVEVSASKDISTALNEAMGQGKKGIFIPAGEWTLSGKVNVYKTVEILGAGPWHTKIVAPKNQTNTDMGFAIAENASGTVLKDFSAWGNYIYRTDGPGKFIDGNKMKNVTVENLWVEHFICLYWGVGACDNTFRDCRIKNVFADGINMTNGSNNNVITNCYARATGDDSFALFSATDNGGSYNVGNEYSNLTAVCPRRAACFAIYGGSDNTYTNLYGADTQTYPGLTISSLSFGYQTLGFGDQVCLVEGVTLDRCGGDFWGNNGSDEGDKFNNYQNFGAVWMYAGDRILQNVTLRNFDINDSVYYGIQVQSMYSGGPASEPMKNIVFENININNPARYGIKFLVSAEAGQGPCVGSATFENVTISNPGLGMVYGLDRCPNFTATKVNCNW